MAKLGEELKAVILGDAVRLDDATNYEPTVSDLLVTLSYEYSVTPVDSQDTGARRFSQTVRVTKKEFEIELTEGTRREFLSFLESKV